MINRILLFFMASCSTLTMTASLFSEEAGLETQDDASMGFNAVKVEHAKGKDLKASIFNKQGIKGLCIHFPTSTLYVPLKSTPKIQSAFGITKYILPKENVEGMLFRNEVMDKTFVLDSTALYENEDSLNYVATSKEARVDIRTNLDGELTQVDVFYETKQGGMKESRKFNQIFNEWF